MADGDPGCSCGVLLELTLGLGVQSKLRGMLAWRHAKIVFDAEEIGINAAPRQTVLDFGSGGIATDP